MEGDLFKAISADNPVKIKAAYKKLAEVKIGLYTAESKQMKKVRYESRAQSLVNRTIHHPRATEVMRETE